MKFITHASETIALILAPPNRTSKPQLTTMLPHTSVDRALSAQESRRNFGRTLRYTLEYTPRFRTAAQSTEFRLGLVRLRDEPVAVPLWDDGITITSKIDGGTSAGIAPGDSPVRYGAEWIFLSADGSTYEIVTVTDLAAEEITLAEGTENEWHPGTVIYPLLFGRFAERPQLKSITPSTVTGGIKIEEDSPYARRITPVAVSLPTVGASVEEFEGTPLWNLEPHWQDILDTTEIDIIYRAIGFLRQEQSLVYQQPVRRGVEMEFVCRSRAAIALIERLFADRRGPVRPFMIPTFRNDVDLAADVAPGATEITIYEGGHFSDPDYASTHPGWPYLALVRGANGATAGAIEPIRVTEIDGPTVTLAEPVAGAFSAWPKDRLSHLMLARFAEPKITWTYLTPTRARCRLKFIETPGEYVDTPDDLPEPFYWYKFWQALPGGDLVMGRYTSYENDVVLDGETFTPAPFSHGAIERTLDLTDRTDLTSWGGNFPGNPLAKFLPFTLEADLWIEIGEGNAAAPDTDPEVLFVGIVKQPQMRGNDWKASVDLGRIVEGKFPRKLVQRSDNYVPFTEPTQLDRADFKVEGTLDAKDGFTVDVDGPDQADNYFAGGELETGADATYEGRSILSSELLAGPKQRLVLDRPLVLTDVGADIDLYPGYNGSLEDCIDRFDNGINFGGYPFMSDPPGPQIKAAEVKTPAGGKKS